MTLGPIMVDIAGQELTADDRRLLMEPAVGGVILFSRNYHSLEQLELLIQSIQLIKSPRLLIAVDHNDFCRRDCQLQSVATDYSSLGTGYYH